MEQIHPRGRPLKPTTNHVGEYVRQARCERGLSLAAVAAQVGISVPYLSDIERGKKNPPVAVWRAIGAAVGCDPGVLKRMYRMDASDRAGKIWDIHNNGE